MFTPFPLTLYLGPVFGNQDHFVGLAIFLDTFRNDLHGMDVSVLMCVCVFIKMDSLKILFLQGPCMAA